MAIIRSICDLTSFMGFSSYLAEVFLLAHSTILAIGGPEYLVRVPDYHSWCDIEDSSSLGGGFYFTHHRFSS